MQKLKPLLLFFLLGSCDSKKESIIDSQKLINKQLTGLADSMKHAGDSESLTRMRTEVHALQYRFDSLGTELKKFK